MNHSNFYLLFIFQFLLGPALWSQNKPIAEPLPHNIKEQFILKATEYRTKGDFLSAIKELDSILIRNPDDSPILLFKGDLLLESKQFEKATMIYQRLIPLNYEPTITKINLSYALFMNNKPSKALEFARKAWEADQENTNAVINHFNAMLWNTKTKNAKKFLTEQRLNLKSSEQILLEARLESVSGNFRKAFKLYGQLVDEHPNKYYAKEYIEVLLGKKQFDPAREVLNKNTTLYSEKELEELNLKFKEFDKKKSGVGSGYFTDNGQNLRFDNFAWFQAGESSLLDLGIKIGNSNIRSIDENITSSSFAQFNANQKWYSTLTGKSELTFNYISSKLGENAAFSITGSQSLTYQPNDRQMIGIMYRSEILDYTASLLEMNVRSHSASYVAHLKMTSKSGLYSQGSYAALTDGNNKYQFFGSIYYTFNNKPLIKSGLNLSALRFTDNQITNYFSPERYLSTEVFAEYSGKFPFISLLGLQIQGATGFQKINELDWDPSFRLNTKITYQHKFYGISLNHRVSNVASATGTGYKFNQITLEAQFKF